MCFRRNQRAISGDAIKASSTRKRRRTWSWYRNRSLPAPVIPAKMASWPSPSETLPTHADLISNKEVDYVPQPQQCLRRSESTKQTNIFLSGTTWRTIWDGIAWQGERRKLGGCRDCVDWDTIVITIPTYIHVIHSGTTRKKYAYTSNPSYIQNQIKVHRFSWRCKYRILALSKPSSCSYDHYKVTDTNANIQFCLMGTTAMDNASWYLC